MEQDSSNDNEKRLQLGIISMHIYCKDNYFRMALDVRDNTNHCTAPLRLPLVSAAL